METTSFLYYYSEKIISIDKIPPILQAFKVVISCPTTEHGGIWVGPLWRHRRTLFKTLKRHLTEFQALWKHIWGICASYFVEHGQDFQMKEVYHLAIQYGVYLRLARLYIYIYIFDFEVRVASRVRHTASHDGQFAGPFGLKRSKQWLKSLLTTIKEFLKCQWTRTYSPENSSFRSTLFEIPPYFLGHEVPFMNTSKATKMIEWPNR